MKISVFPSYGSLNSKPVFDAFIKNLQDKKENFQIDKWDHDTDVAVIWSVLWQGRMRNNLKIWREFQKLKKPVVVLEVGGIKRNTTWKMGINGINRDADFANDEYGKDRWKKFDIKFKPWKTTGKNIIICGQHDSSEQWKDLPRMNEWLLDQVSQIKKHTDKNIIIRPHPRNMISIKMSGVHTQVPRRNPNTYDDTDFVKQLDDAFAVVNHSSNPAMEAVFHGVPVFTSPSSLSYDVANKDYKNLKNPETPDREEWAHKLCHTEWWIDEIVEGVPWARIRKQIEKKYYARD
jgi:hypothetical protein